jgi:four helix bundle protein
VDGKLPYASDYQKLLAYILAVELADHVFTLSETFPREEIYSLTNQIRRASRSVGAQIAEAWGKRSYVKHFKSKLTDAIAELNETVHWIEIAYRCSYIPEQTRIDLIETCWRINKLVYGMKGKAHLFYTDK